MHDYMTPRKERLHGHICPHNTSDTQNTFVYRKSCYEAITLIDARMLSLLSQVLGEDILMFFAFPSSQYFFSLSTLESIPFIFSFADSCFLPT